MELIHRVYNSIARGNLDLKLTKEEFLQACLCCARCVRSSQSTALFSANQYAQITPYEVEVLFHIAELAHP